MNEIIQNAANRQRQAMETLYEATKQKVYFLSSNLLKEQEDIEATFLHVYKNIWSEISLNELETEEDFFAHAIKMTLENCKKLALRRNPKAYKAPLNKNFLHTKELTAVDPSANVTDTFLEQCSELQRLIFVLHTATDYDDELISVYANSSSQNVTLAKNAEKPNTERVINAMGKEGSLTYEDIVNEFTAREQDVVIPENVSKPAEDLINQYATQTEKTEKKRKIRNVLLFIVAWFAVAGLAFGVTKFVRRSKPLEQITYIANPTHYADIKIKDFGTITVALDANSAPITVENFVNLAEEGFYDGLTFHRIVDGFMMQGGCPFGTGEGYSGTSIKGEFYANNVVNQLSHVRGAVAMARMSNNYDSGSCQFYIVQEDCTDLDGYYAVFGFVTSGMDIVDTICKNAATATDENGITGTMALENQPVIETITIRLPE